MSIRRRILLIAGGSVLWVLALSDLASAANPNCPGGTIKVGAVSTVTGPVDFSEAPKATRASFDQLNAAGGINGCKVEYFISDDKGDPLVAAQGARDLIDNKEVVAMVGGASLLECAVNATTYKRKGVMSIQGVGVDPVCFNAPNIAPSNIGPYTETTAVSYYATRSLDTEKLCAIIGVIGGTGEAYKAALARWGRITGQKIHLLDMSLTPGGDVTPYVINIREAGCDAVVTNHIESGAIAFIKAADTQKITGVKWLFLGSAYTAEVAKVLADTSQPVYAATEYEPFTEINSEANKAWIASMRAAQLPLSGFSEAGYFAAKVFVAVIKDIDGPVTRETVSAALLKMKPFKDPLAGSAYIFGEGATHAPMQSTKIVKLDHGQWRVMSPEWLILPPS